MRLDAMFTVHAILSLMLNTGSGISSVHRELRSASKGFFAEASTPFLNRWKRTKSKTDFLIFFASFAISRVFWVPYFVYQTYAVQLKRTDFLLWPSLAFIVLQLVWFLKMCGVALNYKVPKELSEKVADDVKGKVNGSVPNKSNRGRNGNRSKKE